jgi:hypothetical protein
LPWYILGLGLLPPGAMEPYYTEMLKRYGLPPGAVHGGFPQHLPMVYPPVSLANELLHRERERLERLGM